MAKKNDPGLGSKFSDSVTRLINEDGSYNIIRKGGIHRIRDSYKYLIDLHWLSFFALLLFAYLLLNALFAVAYLLLGIDQLIGTNVQISTFFNAFFFSVQTFTSVGYGGITPTGLSSNFLATFEAFIGLVSFAIATGLLYGRFSKPSSKIRYSKNVIIRPYEDGNALMFKLVNIRNNVLLKNKVEVMLILDASVGEDKFNKEYHQLNLETDAINFFPLTWTIVHPIKEESPIFGLNIDQLRKRNAEVVVLLESFDETFSQTVFSKHSFARDQWKENVTFAKNYSINEKGNIELDVNDIDRLEEL